MPGEVERIQFVVSNIRNMLKPGELRGPWDGGASQIFGVQVYHIEQTTSTKLTFAYYNNRINQH